jgi:ketosteroid isomerase-like protein
MRTTLLSCLLCLALLCPLVIGASPEEQQVLDADKAWAAAVLAKDFAKLDAMLTPNLIYAHSTGVIDDKAAYLGKMKAGKQTYKGIEFGAMAVRMHGAAAITHGTLRMHGVNANGPFDDRVMTIHMWVKSGGSWKLAGHQTTKLP